MHFTNNALLSALAATSVLLQAAASPLAVEERTSKSHCASTSGVETCFDVTFVNAYEFTWSMDCKDTKADGHGVYTWLRVWGPNGAIDIEKVANHKGNATSSS
ncbi:hypothetical protein LTR36_008074 [Oleoguttula mirabilis]|uniref:Uncharacterized protein n=1 Tax=Oleoguttula mirabilis TaxID=1507867 RepID=A0AAV9J978_9PEZI|nr:hypothetical protein LTR36_008074 [Oleoguttula mirabilis]